MQRGMMVALLLAFAASSAYADQARGRSGGGHGGRPSGGRVGGGHSAGGHVSGGRSWSGHFSAVRSSGARVSRGYSTGARVTRGYSMGAHYASGGGGRGSYGGGRAVPRGSIGQPPRSSAQGRHSRPGYGTGYSYGRGHGYGRGYGYRNYGYGYGRGYYGGYPYYYGYSPYSWGGLGLSFSFGSGYPYVSEYYAPYDSGYVSDQSYLGGGGVRDEDYYDRDEPRDDGRAEGAELRLVVLPEDASVWVDGEFRGVARVLARLPLPLGRHQIEVVRPGFRTATREVEVRPGSSASVHIELTRP